MTTTQDQDREATTLRVAAALSEFLSDHQAHPWRDCIELATDYTGGSWREAQELAWDAYMLIDRRCDWFGPKGARMIRLPVARRRRVLEVA